MTATLVLDAMDMAAWVRRGTGLDGLVCHSDAGSQGEYTSIAYTDRLADIGALPSIETVGDSYDCEYPWVWARFLEGSSLVLPGAA